MFEEYLAEISAKFNGIILRKAELDRNFERVYLKVFERIFRIEDLEKEILQILGDESG